MRRVLCVVMALLLCQSLFAAGGSVTLCCIEVDMGGGNWVSCAPDLGTTSTWTITGTNMAGKPIRLGSLQYTPDTAAAYQGGASAITMYGNAIDPTPKQWPYTALAADLSWIEFNPQCYVAGNAVGYVKLQQFNVNTNAYDDTAIVAFKFK